MKWADLAKERVADVEKVAKLVANVASRGKDRLLGWLHESLAKQHWMARGQWEPTEEGTSETVTTTSVEISGPPENVL